MAERSHLLIEKQCLQFLKPSDPCVNHAPRALRMNHCIGILQSKMRGCLRWGAAVNIPTLWLSHCMFPTADASSTAAASQLRADWDGEDRIDARAVPHPGRPSIGLLFGPFYSTIVPNIPAHVQDLGPKPRICPHGFRRPEHQLSIYRYHPCSRWAIGVHL